MQFLSPMHYFMWGDNHFIAVMRFNIFFQKALLALRLDYIQVLRRSLLHSYIPDILWAALKATALPSWFRQTVESSVFLGLRSIGETNYNGFDSITFT